MQGADDKFRCQLILKSAVPERQGRERALWSKHSYNHRICNLGRERKENLIVKKVTKK